MEGAGGNLGWMALGAAFFTMLGILVRQFVPLRRLKVEAEQQLRDDLFSRVAVLEATLERERLRREADRRIHEAERSLDRHKIGNVTQCLDAVLLMLETSPEKAPEIVARIKEMRSAQIEAEAKESAIIRAAMIRDAEEAEEAAREIEEHV